MLFGRRSEPGALEIASGLYQGDRDYQQDSIETYVIEPEKLICSVLSDGMGGHKYGNLASRAIVSSCIKSLKAARADITTDISKIPSILRASATAANRRLSTIVHEQTSNETMGGTLVVFIIADGKLFWCSVGDSPMYLLRDSKLRQLNENHSLGQGLSDLAKLGRINAKTAAVMASKSTLTSVLNGKKLSQMDCPSEPFKLRKGDLVLLASDGIETLTQDEIAELLNREKDGSAAEICSNVIAEVEGRAAPKQDNLSTSVVVVG